MDKVQKRDDTKSRRTISQVDEDAHDADVMRLLTHVRKDVIHLENIIDLLRESCSKSNRKEEDKDVDVLSIGSDGETCASPLVDDYLITERNI